MALVMILACYGASEIVGVIIIIIIIIIHPAICTVLHSSYTIRQSLL